MSKRVLSRLLCLGLLLLAEFATAQDYNSVVQSILESGKVDGPVKYLEFRDGNLRQYAIAQMLDTGVIQVAFIEEVWTKTADNDVIDQWVVEVTPDLIERAVVIAVLHHEMVEHDSVVLADRKLSTEGAERVVQRIAEKTVGVGSPEQ